MIVGRSVAVFNFFFFFFVFQPLLARALARKRVSKISLISRRMLHLGNIFSRGAVLSLGVTFVLIARR